MPKWLSLLLVAILILSTAGCSFGLSGGDGINISGNESDSSITIGLDGSVVRGVLADTGNATGSGHQLEIVGSGDVSTSASGNTVTITAESAGITFCNIEVFHGSNPTSTDYTNLSLSAWVGNNTALVLLYVHDNETNQIYYFKASTDLHGPYSGSLGRCLSGSSTLGWVLVKTNTVGVVQWYGTAAHHGEVYLAAYWK
jgi:hypothetical protein